MTTNLAELAALVGGEVSGDDQLIVTGAATLSAARTGDITLADSAEKLLRLAHSAASAAVVSKSLVYQGLPTIRVDDCHAAFAKIVCRYRLRRVAPRTGISPRAFVSPTAQIGADVEIHPGASVGDEVTIGPGSTIHSGVQLMAGCQLGPNAERLFVTTNWIEPPKTVCPVFSSFKPGEDVAIDTRSLIPSVPARFVSAAGQS